MHTKRQNDVSFIQHSRRVIQSTMHAIILDVGGINQCKRCHSLMKKSCAICDAIFVVPHGSHFQWNYFFNQNDLMSSDNKHIN